MSTQQDSKIQFLLRMNRANNFFVELAEFLRSEKLIADTDLKDIMRKPLPSQAQEFYLLLKKNEEVFQLVSWEWTILPSEFMKLTIVTRNGVKEFSNAD